MIKLSIIIVNYRSTDLIIDCVTSIYQFTKNILFEIIIVDNASNNNGEEIIKEKFPEVRWIQMSDNAGFARANNEGIRQSKGGTILLLNPDTLVENNAIGNCYEAFNQSNFVACGVQLLNPDTTPQISGNYFIAGGVNHFLSLPFLGNVFKGLGKILKVKKTNLPEAIGNIEVDWVNGAFLMVKKSVIEKAGLLDEDFFLFAEEIEWCSRLRKRGQLCIYGNLNVIHLQGETANETFSSSGKGYFNLADKKGRQIMLSNFVRIRKQFGVGWFLFHLFVYFIEIPFFFVVFLCGRKSFWQFKGYCKNVFFVLGKSKLVIKNKPYFYKVL